MLKSCQPLHNWHQVACECSHVQGYASHIDCNPSLSALLSQRLTPHLFALSLWTFQLLSPEDLQNPGISTWKDEQYSVIPRHLNSKQMEYHSSARCGSQLLPSILVGNCTIKSCHINNTEQNLQVERLTNSYTSLPFASTYLQASKIIHS